MAITPEYIKGKRKENGWTQEDLADKMSVTPRTIKIWEKDSGAVPKSKEAYLIQVLENKGEVESDYVVYIPKTEFLKTSRIIIKLTCLLLFIISCTPKKKDYGSNVFICSEGSSYHINKECAQLKKCSKDILMMDRSDLLDVHPEFQKQPCAICAE